MLIPIAKELLYSRHDSTDPRLGDIVKVSSLSMALSEIKKSKQSHNFGILGYPDDEGITLNGGRAGAALGPSRIRKYLYRMTPPAFLKQEVLNNLDMHDLGDLDAGSQKSILARHEFAQKTVLEILDAEAKVVSFGGGHDYGFPDAAAFCEYSIRNGERPLVINFDAHLDVRPTVKGLTSGTPFFRLLENYPEIDFVELGLQGQCNSQQHLKWAEERGALCSFEEERMAEGISLTSVLQRFIGESALRRRMAYLSIDIDGFTSAVAPGASQSWPTGFQPNDFFDSLSWCLQRLNVRSIGIYETSPPLDIDDRTSRLAALIAHRFMFQL